MTYFAFEGGVGQHTRDGAVKISAAQYSAAIEGMLLGRVVTVAGGQFAIADKPIQPEPEPEPAAPIDLAAYTAHKRWEKEVGGILVGGMPIATDDRSKTMIIGARVKAENAPGFTTPWKGANGEFITIDAATTIAISDAVLAHVAACFALEDAVLGGIAAGEITTPVDIDAAFA